MTTKSDETWLFVVEWYDPMPRLKKSYLLKYFVEQHMVEMVDLKTKKIFLKKSACPPEMTIADFFLGGKILLYSRDLEIVDYGDLKTRDKLQFQIQQVIVVLSPDTYQYWGKYIDSIHQQFNIIKMKSLLFSSNVADNVCQSLEVNPRISNTLSKGVNLIIVAQADDGFNKITSLISSLNSRFGTIAYSSANGMQSSSLTELLLSGSAVSNSATLDSCTCCIIKPHAVKALSVGKIIDMVIAQGYEVSAVATLQFGRVQAEEFLEVYKGVVPEYMDHVAQLSLGTCVALELRAEGAVTTFRQSAGPWDVEMAKDLYPETIRAMYGVNRVLNAVHCTDLPQDGAAECEFCFRLMQ